MASTHNQPGRVKDAGTAVQVVRDRSEWPVPRISPVGPRTLEQPFRRKDC